MSDSDRAGPLVSVILPVRDRADCVARAIRSVLDQRYRNIELIVIDDGSRDATAAVVTGFGDAVRLLRQAGSGVSAARNHGLAVARGELVAFIDSDDFWYPDKLSRQVPMFADGKVALVFADARHVSIPVADAPATGRTSFDMAPPPCGGEAADFGRCNFVPTSTVVARRAVLAALGNFPAVPVTEDYPLWVDVALRHDLAYVDDCLADYTVHAGGISQNLERMLDARLDIFADRLRTAGDAKAGEVYRRIAFNAAASLTIAGLRGAGGRATVKGLAGMLGYGRLHTLPWLVRFLFDRRQRGNWRSSHQLCSIRKI